MLAGMAEWRDGMGFVNTLSIHNAGKGAGMEVQTKITITLAVTSSCWHWLQERTRSPGVLVKAQTPDAQFTRGEPCAHGYIIPSKFLGFGVSFFSPTSHPKFSRRLLPRPTTAATTTTATTTSKYLVCFFYLPLLVLLACLFFWTRARVVLILEGRF